MMEWLHCLSVWAASWTHPNVLVSSWQNDGAHWRMTLFISGTQPQDAMCTVVELRQPSAVGDAIHICYGLSGGFLLLSTTTTHLLMLLEQEGKRIRYAHHLINFLHLLTNQPHRTWQGGFPNPSLFAQHPSFQATRGVCAHHHTPSLEMRAEDLLCPTRPHRPPFQARTPPPCCLKRVMEGLCPKAAPPSLFSSNNLTQRWGHVPLPCIPSFGREWEGMPFPSHPILFGMKGSKGRACPFVASPFNVMERDLPSIASLFLCGSHCLWLCTFITIVLDNNMRIL